MTEDFIPTRGSSWKKPETINYVSVKYEGHKSQAKENRHAGSVPQKQKEDEEKEFNVRKVKHEIVKFGIGGFDGRKQEEAKIQLAIKLGARPPKNKYKNYKELIAERRKAKKVQESSQNFQQLGKNSSGKSLGKGKSFDRKRRKNKTNSILEVYGKVKTNSVS